MRKERATLLATFTAVFIVGLPGHDARGVELAVAASTAVSTSVNTAVDLSSSAQLPITGANRCAALFEAPHVSLEDYLNRLPVEAGADHDLANLARNEQRRFAQLEGLVLHDFRSGDGELRANAAQVLPRLFDVSPWWGSRNDGEFEIQAAPLVDFLVASAAGLDSAGVSPGEGRDSDFARVARGVLRQSERAHPLLVHQRLRNLRRSGPESLRNAAEEWAREWKLDERSRD